MRRRVIALVSAAALVLSACGDSAAGKAAATTAAPTTAASVAETEAQATEAEKAAAETEGYVFVPEKDFNIRVPFAAGGSVDTIVRIFGQGLQKTYDKSVIVNNMPGANGAIAATDLNSAKTDATELMAGGIAMFALAPLFNKDVHLNLDDYQFVSGLIEEDMLLFVDPNRTGIEDWAGFQEYAKNNRVIYGANTPGGATHLLATMLFGESGIESEAVTSDGSAKDLLALAGGNVVCTVAPSSLGKQYVEEGTLIPIMVFSDESYKGYDGLDVPTAKSFGYDIVFKSCNFIIAKKDVDTKDVEAIRQAMVDYSETDEFKELAANASYTPSLRSGDEVRTIIENAYEMCRTAYEKYYTK